MIWSTLLGFLFGCVAGFVLSAMPRAASEATTAPPNGPPRPAPKFPDRPLGRGYQAGSGPAPTQDPSRYPYRTCGGVVNGPKPDGAKIIRDAVDDGLAEVREIQRPTGGRGYEFRETPWGDG